MRCQMSVVRSKYGISLSRLLPTSAKRGDKAKKQNEAERSEGEMYKQEFQPIWERYLEELSHRRPCEDWKDVLTDF